jgi:hypothetical protein
MKKIVILIGVVISTMSLAFSQNEVDALRYSYMVPGGTARYNAMGGSFGALGADASVLYSNPAGMGVYQSSEFTISPSFEITNTSALYAGQNSSDYDVNFNINNIAYIGTLPINNENGLASINFGMAYSRLNNFNENVIIEGKNDYNSMTDWFAKNGNGTYFTDLYNYSDTKFYSNLAWESYLIDQNPSDSMSYVSVMNSNYGQTQKKYIYRDGNQGEYDFSMSANVMNKLYIGATIGLQSIKYNEVSTFEEIDTNDSVPDFISFRFKENLETRGSGVNFKIGLLYRPIKWIRFGAAIHTPTFYSLTDNFSTTVTSKFASASKSKTIDSDYGTSDYELTSPFKAIASLGFIIGKQALVNIDYEYTDYTLARLRSYDYGFFDENANIRSEYKASNNLKAGFEYRYGPVSFRLGGSYFDSPYASNHINKDAYTLVYSGGIGLRSEDVYFDVSYSYILNNNYYFMYEGYDMNSPATAIEKQQNRIVTTLGFKF